MTNAIRTRFIKPVAAGFLALALLASFAPFLKTGDAEAASGTVGRHTQPSVMCVKQRTTGLFVHVEQPDIYSAIMGYQQVSWRPILNRWDGSRWVAAAFGREVFGTAGVYYPATYGLFGVEGQGFNAFTPGSYRVSVEYRWFTNDVVTGYDHLWAGTHTLYFVTSATQPGGNVFVIGGQGWDREVRGDWCQF